MTRRMADSTNVAALPVGFDVYGCYDDGSFNNVNACRARFPNTPLCVFTVFPKDNFGDVLDVEKYDANPDQAPGWVVMRRTAGADPGVYCSLALWPTVIAAFNDARVPLPWFIIAAYPGPGPVLIAGALGHQWIDHGGWDESVVADYLPGIDPAPVPPLPVPTYYPGDNMLASPVEVGISAGHGWLASPVPTAKVVNVTINDTNPDTVGAYNGALPTFVGVAEQVGPHSPNGALVFTGPADGTFGCVIWSVD